MAWRVPEAVAGAVEESRAALRGALAEPLGAWRQDVASKRPGPVVFSSPGGAEVGSWRRFRAELLFSMPAQDGAEGGGGGGLRGEPPPSRHLRELLPLPPARDLGPEHRDAERAAALGRRVLVRRVHHRRRRGGRHRAR